MDIFMELIPAKYRKSRRPFHLARSFCMELIKRVMLQFFRLAKVTGINSPNM